ncbi:MAG TPA: hypothetical protein VJU14_05330 [Solirubrobacterales bacterium]|nr:hypothetical protein [Solirubrobacterales bacterium]
MRLIKLAIIGVAFAALASGAIAGAAEPPPAEEESSALLAEGCFANAICRYVGTEFNVRDKVIECSSWGEYAGFGASARNRCGNKSVWLRQNKVVVACMNPGGDRPHPGLYNEIFVPFNYGAAC